MADSDNLVEDTLVAMTTLPKQLRQSLTWDRGKELAQHAQFKIDTGTAVYFADSHSPWQRGTNENTNGLLRQYFPKGTDLSVHPPEHLRAVEDELSKRPCLVLASRTPAVLFATLLASTSQRLLRR
jgi:IS30 family transposase